MSKIVHLENYVAYIRVSTEKQAKENDSIEGQKNAILSWAEANNINITNFYTDAGSSGFNGARPEFHRMIYDIDKKYITTNGILVYSFSRFSRNELNRLIAEEKLKKVGVRVVSVTEQLPVDDDSAFLMKSIIGTVNEHQSRQNSRVVQDRLNDTARAGYYPGGTLPIGYKSIPVTVSGKLEKKKLVIFPEEAETVKTIFKLAEKGVEGIPLGVKAIATYLNTHGLKKRGKTWETNDVHRILINSVYFGELIFGKNRIRKKPEIPPIVINVPAIISKEQFLKVQSGLKSRRITNFSNKGPRSPTLLTGIMKCGYCGSNLVIQTGKGGKYKYYKCRSQMVSGVKLCKCPIIPQKDAEEAIIQHVLSKTLTEAHITTVIDNLKLCLKESTKEDTKKLTQKKGIHTRTKKQLNNLFTEISENKIELDEYLSSYLRDLKQTLLIQKSEIEDLSKRKSLGLKNFGIRKVRLFIKAAKNVLAKKGDDAKKAFLLGIIKDIVVNQETMNIRGNNYQIAAIVSKTKMGTSNEVPIFVTKWR